MTGVCIVAMLLCFTLGISGGPLNTVAGYVFIPMQKGINSVGAWFGEKSDNLKKLSDVMAENEELQRQVDELTTELNTIKLEQYELENLRELFVDYLLNILYYESLLDFDIIKNKVEDF